MKKSEVEKPIFQSGVKIDPLMGLLRRVKLKSPPWTPGLLKSYLAIATHQNSKYCATRMMELNCHSISRREGF